MLQMYWLCVHLITKIKSKPDRRICKHNIQNPKIFDNNPDLYSAFDKRIYGKDERIVLIKSLHMDSTKSCKYIDIYNAKLREPLSPSFIFLFKLRRLVNKLTITSKIQYMICLAFNYY